VQLDPYVGIWLAVPPSSWWRCSMAVPGWVSKCSSLFLIHELEAGALAMDLGRVPAAFPHLIIFVYSLLSRFWHLGTLARRAGAEFLIKHVLLSQYATGSQGNNAGGGDRANGDRPTNH